MDQEHQRQHTKTQFLVILEIVLSLASCLLAILEFVLHPSQPC
jgi:hypothetical protein